MAADVPVGPAGPTQPTQALPRPVASPTPTGDQPTATPESSGPVPPDPIPTTTPATVATGPRRPRRWIPRPLRGDLPWVVLIAGLLVWAVTEAKTGSNVSVTSPPLLAVTGISGLICLAAALLSPRTSRSWGMLTLLAGAALIVVTGLSIIWSVSPDQSWFETNRTLAYIAVIAGGAGAARLAPGRWQAPLGGVLLGTTVICGLGLATKVFPASLDPDQVFARLQAPIGYWNAVGTISAIALVLALWLGTRRDGYRPLNALAYPIAALSFLTLLQSYSRGGLVAAGVGVLVWMLLAPRRLHSLLVLVVGLLGGGFVGIWTFAKPDLSTDGVTLGAREAAGAELGLLILTMLGLLLAIGLVIEFATVFTGMRSVERRRLGTTIALAVAVIPLAGIAVLATSERGLTGSVSNAYTQLTDPRAAVPGSDPSRLKGVGSERGSYWRQSFDLYRMQPVHGIGAGGFAYVQSRVRTPEDSVAKHSHGWVPQTLADTGWIGMIVQLLLGLAWLGAAARAIGVWGPLRRGTRTAERDGIAAAIAVVFAFAVISLADWTWFLPGVALPVMLLAGWVAGRGAEAAFAGGALGHRPRISVLSPRTAVAVAVLIVTATACFSIAQPWRSAHAQDTALVAIGSAPLVDDATPGAPERRARALVVAAQHAEDGRRWNPLSTKALYTLARVRALQGNIEGARRLYGEAIKLEPAVPESWQRLADFELETADRPTEAQRAVGVALKLAPTSRAANLLTVAIGRRIALADQEQAPATDATDPAAAGSAPPAATPPAGTNSTGTTPAP